MDAQANHHISYTLKMHDNLPQPLRCCARETRPLAGQVVGIPVDAPFFVREDRSLDRANRDEHVDEPVRKTVAQEPIGAAGGS